MIPAAVTSRWSPVIRCDSPITEHQKTVEVPSSLTFSPREKGPLFAEPYCEEEYRPPLPLSPVGEDARIRQSGSNRERENHNHLFFLNHHTVNPVASNVIAI